MRTRDLVAWSAASVRAASEQLGSPGVVQVARPRVEPTHPPELLDQVRLEVRAMTHCPWRGRKVECGCNGARLCTLLRGESGRVTALDCQRCDVARAELLGSLGRMLPAL